MISIANSFSGSWGYKGGARPEDCSSFPPMAERLDWWIWTCWFVYLLLQLEITWGVACWSFHYYSLWRGAKETIFLCPHSDTYLSLSRVQDDDDDGDSDDCGRKMRWGKENSPVRIKLCLRQDTAGTIWRRRADNVNLLNVVRRGKGTGAARGSTRITWRFAYVPRLRDHRPRGESFRISLVFSARFPSRQPTEEGLYKY